MARNTVGDDTLSMLMFPFLAFGHISPFVQLSTKLASFPGVTVTFLTTPACVRRVSEMISSSAGTGKPHPVRILTVELPDVDGLPKGAESTSDVSPMGAELLKVALDRMQPQIGALLADIRPHIVIHDFAQQWLHSVAHPLGIKTVYFSVFSAVASAFLVVPSRGDLERTGEAETRKAMELPPPRFPRPPYSSIESVPLFQANGFAYVFKRFFDMPSTYNRVVTAMNNCSAIAFKTCMDVEGPYIRSLEQEYNKPVFLAGPLVPEPTAEEDPLDSKWAEWLDRFEEGSVIFSSFGSETFLSDDEIRELALGLELTGRPFLLVINFHKADGEGSADVDGIKVDTVTMLQRKLPEGLEGRLAGRGMVHSGWVQQRQILSHKSVGYFLCHAGLSSLTEGLVLGCHLLLLPQKGDQFLNARLFAGDLRVAVEVRRRDEDGWFSREDIKDAVREVTADDEKGRQLRENHCRWRDFFAATDMGERFMAEFVEKLRALAADKA